VAAAVAKAGLVTHKFRDKFCLCEVAGHVGGFLEGKRL
jgi:hypothetical protein